MDTSKLLDSTQRKYLAERSKRKSIEQQYALCKKEKERLVTIIKDKESVDILTTVSAIHELRKINRKLDIYHVAMVVYLDKIGKCTSSQFMRRFNSGKNKFYEVMSEMKEMGYIDTLETLYKKRRVWFFLTDKGHQICARIKEKTNDARLLESKEKKITDGKA